MFKSVFQTGMCFPISHGALHRLLADPKPLLYLNTMYSGPSRYQPTLNIDDDDNFPTLADFYFHVVGDKTVYNSGLEHLFVCYTLTRGLQLESVSPRRPAIPLELILRITRFAGFVDVNPDPTLTLDIKDHLKLTPTTWGTFASRLSRTHLLSMARVHLAPLNLKRPLGVGPRVYCVSPGRD